MKKLASLLITASLLVPVAASAATADELIAQLQVLLAQVRALEAQQAGSQGGTTSGPGNPATGGAVACPHVSRTLRFGSSGEDVSRLQRFLALDPTIYPEGQVTGYYGSLTQAAVQRWQAKFYIVSSGTPDSTGYGVVGPRTAAILALQCPGQYATGSGETSASGFFRVTPTSGNAPLAVTIEATVNTTKSCSASTYEIYYGDNSAPATITVPQGGCGEFRQVFNHTYTGPGTYTVTLRSGVHQTNATVQVLGADGGGSGGTNQNVGPFTITPNINGDALTIRADFQLASSCAAYSLDWGDTTAGSSQPQGTCTSGPVTKSITHTYLIAGQYTVTLLRGTTLQFTDSAALTIVSN